jgi:hypothetical protein
LQQTHLANGEGRWHKRRTLKPHTAEERQRVERGSAVHGGRRGDRSAAQGVTRRRGRRTCGSKRRCRLRAHRRVLTPTRASGKHADPPSRSFIRHPAPRALAPARPRKWHPPLAAAPSVAGLRAPQRLPADRSARPSSFARHHRPRTAPLASSLRQ